MNTEPLSRTERIAEARRVRDAAYAAAYAESNRARHAAHIAHEAELARIEKEYPE